MSVPKFVLMHTRRLVFLGVVCDSVIKRFEVSQDKLGKLEVILHTAADENSITFPMLEKPAAKCTSMSVAVPPVVLYTHYIYRVIGGFRHSGGTGKAQIAAELNSGRRFEINKWLEFRRSINGSPWYSAAHRMLTLTGATDASSEAWGGPIKAPGFPNVSAMYDFPEEWTNRHFNVQEAYALLEALKLFCKEKPQQLAGTRTVVDVDSKTLYLAFKKGTVVATD